MKSILTIGLVGILSATSANAGWLSDLFSKKTEEPATLAEACNIDEITQVCPEIILGQKTLVECLTDNVKTVSQKCVDYVKKAVSENSEEVATITDAIKTATAEKTEGAKAEATDKVEEIKKVADEKIDAAKLEIAAKLLESVATEQK